MQVVKILTKTNEYIRIATSNSGANMYSYYVNDEVTKCTFNKASFIEYLKSVKVPKKYIKEVI